MKKILAPLLFVFLVGCAGSVVPATSQERYIAAVYTYVAFDKTVTEAANKGYIRGDNRGRVKAAKQAALLALDTWGANPDDPLSERAWVLSLRAAQALLNAIPTGEPPT